MDEARQCSNCGGRPTAEDQRFCGFCGVELPLPEAAPQVVVHTGPYGDLEARFAALDDHPDLDRLRQHVPSTTGKTASMFGQVAFGLLFTGMALFITFMFGAVAGPMAVFPLIGVVAGVILTLGGLKRAGEYSSAPLRRIKALVVDERVKVSGGSNNRQASTAYYATLQDPEGHRVEYQVDEDIAAEVREGDIGLAFVKGPVLVDFARIRV